MKIVIKNINLIYLKVLQLKLLEYHEYIIKNISSTDYTSFCESLVMLEHLYKIGVIVYRKIESYGKKPVNFKLCISESIVLQSACNYRVDSDGTEENAIYQNISDQVHQQITNIKL